MHRTSSAPVPSLKFFRQYCAALLELRDRAAQPASADDLAAAEPIESDTDATAASASAGMSSSVAVQTAAPPTKVVTQRVHVIWNRLILLLDRQLMEASRIAGPLGMEFHREAVYVMAALTDELFVHLEWEGREFWLAHLLEAHLFQSHFAGEQFFRRIDALLLREDDSAAELAGVYLAALALGFRGRYWGPQHAPILDRYRTRLFVLMTRRDPSVAETGEHLFPDAYQNTIAEGAAVTIPEPRRWLWGLAAIVVIWVVATLIVWHNLTAGLRHQLCCLSPECSESCAPASSK